MSFCVLVEFFFDVVGNGAQIRKSKEQISLRFCLALLGAFWVELSLEKLSDAFVYKTQWVSVF